MKKAFITGIGTGIILSLIFIAGTYIKKLFPAESVMEDIVFLVLFFGVVTATLWISMNRLSHKAPVEWRSLNVTGIVASIMAAILFGVAGFLYTRYIHPGYLAELSERSTTVWESRNYSLTAISGEGQWEWLNTPMDYALLNFKDTLIVLAVLALVLATVYYRLNRKRLSGFNSTDNQELIF